MPSTRNTVRKAPAGPPISRIPVPKASRTTANVSTARHVSPRRKVTTVSSSTRVLRSSLSRTPTGANKENYPILPRPGFLSRANPISPSRMKKDGVGKKPFGKSRVQRAKRQPLRELTEAEVFERDEAVMGDLRRRRVSGENYLLDSLGDSVIFDSFLAHETARPEAAESSSPNVPEETEVDKPAEPESPLVVYKPKIEKFKVLRHSDSEERLTASMESIIAAAQKTVVDSAKRPRTRAALAKKQHPAVRTSLDSIENYSPDIMLRSAENSVTKPARTRATRQSSPFSGTKHFAGVSKVQPSPSPLKVSRVGLGAKSANTAYVMKKVFEGGKLSEKGKMVLKDTTAAAPTKAVTRKKSVTTTTTTTKETKVTARKANSSLKRAAGVTAGVSSARVGLAGIGRMR
ncbi:hypothetical protein BGX38DRAFT_1144725 [Terfezia claveryi]|nr:hypothetical protein BGX38DRAFT_1144725 [Terfezia claveryi]